MATVKEFVKHLKALPQDAPVMLSTYGCGQIFRYEYELNRVTFDPKKGQVVLEAEDN